MSTDTSAQRAAFEAWFAESRKSKGPSRRPTFERFVEDGTYADDSTQRHWWTWQHAASPQPTAAPVRSMSTDTPAQPLQGGFSNAELTDAWGKKLPGVIPTDRELTSFALGIEVGQEHARNLERQYWSRVHHVLAKHGAYPGRIDDHLADVIDRALAASPQPTAAPVAELVEALLTAIKAEDRARFHWIECGCGTPEMDRWDAAIEAREKAAEAVRAALSRAPGASNVRAKRETRDE